MDPPLQCIPACGSPWESRTDHWDRMLLPVTGLITYYKLVCGLGMAGKTLVSTTALTSGWNTLANSSPSRSPDVILSQDTCVCRSVISGSTEDSTENKQPRKQSSAPSTQSAYIFSWKLFWKMALSWSLELALYQILKILTFLQGLLDSSKCLSMLKVHVAAIAVHYGWNPSGIWQAY